MLKTSKMPKGYEKEFKGLVDRINDAKKEGLYVFEPPFGGPQKGTSKCKGKDVIMLTSNNYLGLSTHPEIIKAMKDALDIYGTGTCGARLHNGTTILHEKLEERIAQYMRTESAVVFSAGYMSNLGAITAMATDEKTLIITDQLNHMSIVDGIEMSKGQARIFTHNDMDKLDYILSRSEAFEKKLIVVDGVYSMDGDIAPLDKIVELAEKYDAMIMVDDAHALGFYGETGRGTSEHFGLEDKVHIKMSTFSKSLAGVGGCIAANADVCDYMRHVSHQYIFNASLPPVVVAGVLKAYDLMETETWRRDKLWANTIRFRKGLIELGYNIMDSISPIVPIYIGDDMTTMKMTKRLMEEGVYIASALFPAVPMNKSRFRVTITAALSEEEIDMALCKLEKVGKEFKVI
ncbi:pyridoxal phosphate-dependent aminotransferase family protein [Clostridium sp. FP2]|uniref:aminotransferase class I/II-fold pyridoxal phosphate-dependent enzyme n=1 Tax=Clostridium sp. FP2 TaxID=2724481 RepID=UPI0013E99002|nr:pyridoxal phosphate-dependent aminotransferase family protein [Clostridium sp. FP2]MBZ9625582.1 pyridoxal phosphate-dependent aminotransferase family protein [Clostridium sp. FP2]